MLLILSLVDMVWLCVTWNAEHSSGVGCCVICPTKHVFDMKTALWSPLIFGLHAHVLTTAAAFCASGCQPPQWLGLFKG